MDFGFIYMRDRAASQATMGLGCLVFILFIFVPFIAAYLFIPLYIAVIIKLAYFKFHVENTWSILFAPFAPYLVAAILCLPFWWAIPTLVNIVNESLAMFRGDVTLFGEAIPDNKCFQYFIIFFGGSFGSLICFASLIMGFEKIDTIDTYTWSEEYWQKTKAISGDFVARKFCPTVDDIVKDYKNGLIDCDEANYRIKTRFKKWTMDNFHLTKRDAEYKWKQLKWLIEIK